MKRLILLLLASICVQACGSSEQYSLDKSIPRLQTPPDQIASLRTKWYNGDHVETVFYNHQGQVVERFSFGMSSSKEIHFYEGGAQKKSIYYSHGDSSGPGVISIDTVVRTFDENDRKVLEMHSPLTMYAPDQVQAGEKYELQLTYTAEGDTLLKPKIPQDYTPLADINQWRRDKHDRLESHYRLYVMHGNKPDEPDTIDHYLQRFAYDTRGRMKMAWFDYMYLGEFYLVPGPDTIWYHYDSRNRLSEEQHLYSTDLRNKREIDTTKISP